MKPASSSTIDDEPLLVTQGVEVNSAHPLSQINVASNDNSLLPGNDDSFSIEQDVMNDYSLSLEVTKREFPKKETDYNFPSGKHVTDSNSMHFQEKSSQQSI